MRNVKQMPMTIKGFKINMCNLLFVENFGRRIGNHEESGIIAA